MFKRIIIEDWLNWVPYVAFSLTFLAFISIVIKALMMKRKQVDHMANLPLEDDDKA